MDMELGTATEDRFLNDASHIAKGKRTKRNRPLSPCDVAAAAAITSSSSSATADYGSFSSSTTTFEDEEEADMANCLILLAQGKTGGEETTDEEEEEEDNKMREKSRRISEVTTTATTVTTAKIGFYIYECKTCNRTFPSFQALGGHRASHKKPKLTSEDKIKKSQQQSQPNNTFALITTNCDFEERKQASVTTSPPPISFQLGYGGGGSNNNNNNNNKHKIHECSICGSEFTSGQALGGHMRRHRTPVMANTTPHQVSCDVAVKPPRNVLELDLNLPAPADDDHHRDSKFQFAATQKTMMLSAAPPLVDCHY